MLPVCVCWRCIACTGQLCIACTGQRCIEQLSDHIPLHVYLHFHPMLPPQVHKVVALQKLVGELGETHS